MQSTLAPNTKTGGLLLAAFERGETEEIRWVDVKVGDLIITVASDAMKATLGERAGVRLPVSYHETVEICRALDCVAPTQAMADAMFAQATSQLNFVPLVQTAADTVKMTWADFTLKFNDGVEKQLAAQKLDDPGLIAGAWKYWLLHPRLVERGAVNYGFWDKRRKPPRPIQTVGGRHDASHYDYSQLLQPIKRMARLASTGEEVDLLEYIGKTDKVPQRFLDVYEEQPQAFAVTPEQPESSPVKPADALGMLAADDLETEYDDGWESRGRAGFTPEGIMVHHTAGPKTGDAPSLRVCRDGRPDLRGPLCHIFLARSGKVHVLGANITNHAGKGAQQVLDLVRRDKPVEGNARDNKYADAIFGNQWFYGIEVENSGQKGDAYPDAQIDALAHICATICQAHNWTANRVVHHRQWTSRKIDMSWRGDLPSMVAQYMDTLTVSFSTGMDPTKPMWEPPEDAR